MNEYALLEMPITAIEIMAKRAQITRKCGITKEQAGQKNFVIKNLPLLLNDASVRVDISDGALITRLSGKISRSEELEEADFEPVKLDIKEEALDKELEWHQEEIKELEELEFHLPDEMISEHERFKCAKPVEKWQEFLNCRADIIKEHLKKIDELLAQKEALNEERKALANKRSKQNSESSFKELYITFDRPLTSDAEVTLTYQVLGALWRPIYELRVNSSAKVATLSLMASIAQMSGEEWPAVPITLTSSDVNRIASLPPLPSWRIGRPQAATEAWRPLPEDSAKLLDDYLNFVNLCKNRENAQAQKTREPKRQERRLAPPPMASAAMMGAAPMPKPGFFAGMANMMGKAPMAMASMARGKMAAESCVADDTCIADEDICCEEACCEEVEKSSDRSAMVAEVTAGQPGREFLDYSELQMVGAINNHAGELRPKGRAKTADNALEGATLRWLTENNSKEKPAYLVNYSGYSAVPIAPDGRFRKVPITSLELPLAIEYWAIPRETLELFRCGSLTNGAAFHLLAGIIEIYWDNQMLLSTKLPAVASGETFKLPLGIEERCSIRRDVQHNERQSGLISPTVTYSDSVTMEFISRVPEPIDIHLLDRIPSTTSGDITITLQSAEPKTTEFLVPGGVKPADGVLGWLITCSPGQKEQVTFAYSIEIPAKQEVVGGGRRA